MTIAEAMWLAAALLAGAAVGAVYFLGLWWTVRRLPTAKQPWMLTLVSFAVRGGLAVAVFYLVMAGDWRRLAACLVGFILARVVLTRRQRAERTPGEAAPHGS